MALFPSVFGAPDDMSGGILGGYGQQAMQQQRPMGDMLLALGAGIAGGNNWGQGIGAGLQGALQAKQFHQKLAGGGIGPASVQEYKFAIQNGFKGSFQDWIDAKGRGDQRYGLQPVYAQDDKGNVRAFQLDSSGGLKPIDFGQGLTPAPGVTNLNTGTSFQPVNTRTGQPAAPPIPINNAGAAAATAGGKIEGENLATATIDLPRVEDQANSALETIEKIRTHAGRGSATGWMGLTPGIPNTSGRGFVALVDQAKGKTFLEAYQSLKGGGAIDRQEGLKAEQAIARLDRAQSQKDFDSALDDLKEVIQLGVNRARTKANQPPVAYPPRGQATTPAPMASPPATKTEARMPSGQQGVVPAELQSRPVSEQLGAAPEGSRVVMDGKEYVKKNHRWVPVQ